MEATGLLAGGFLLVRWTIHRPVCIIAGMEYAAERSEYRDARTGRRVVRWTSSAAKDQHLYFTSPSVTADDRWLVFIGERSGAPNVHVIDRVSGRIRQISRAARMMRAYVYPTGAADGLSKASPCLDAARGVAYWIEDDRVMRAAVGEGPIVSEAMAKLPPGNWMTGFNHVSPDGGQICVPVADARLFVDSTRTQAEQMQAVMKRHAAHGYGSRILIFDTRTGKLARSAEVPFWATHVQFDPKNTGRVLFNQEGGRELPSHRNARIWRLHTNDTHDMLFEQPGDEYVNHENWSPSGDAIVYHGEKDGSGRRAAFTASRTWQGALLWRCEMADLHIAHATCGQDGRTFFLDDVAGPLMKCVVETGTGRYSAEHLCDHGSSFTHQDNHAHPIVNAAGTGVVFTSDRDGVENVFEVVL